jgi:peptidoglycan/xylan/chitin deacetylase (PgdA/CDA1 family)
MRSISDKHTNPNGCNMPVTWFVLQLGTDCETAKTLWEQNHEMALHTVNHVSLYASYTGNLTKEMMGVRDYLNKTCGLPLTDLVGYRNPYLVNNPATRKIQEANGILYDSSMIQVFQNDSESETGPGMRVWPFTMDQGIPINCNWNYPDGQCNGTTERYPGLWEVPLWELQNAAGDHLYSMDVGTNPPGDIYNILLENFNMNYNNNRAPFGIYLHSTWFDTPGVNAAAMNKFLDYAMAQPNVWAVTTTQLIKWMQAPVPASQMGEWLKCNPVNLTAPTEADIKCQLYTVKEGDSSYSVATAFAVVTEDLLAVNPEIGTGASLTVGEQIRIPKWDDTCVGDVVKPVTGPGQVAITDANTEVDVPTDDTMPTSGDAGTEGAPSGMPFDINNPSSGVNLVMTLSGRPQLAFQTDLKQPFTQEVARALGVKPEAVKLMGITPMNTVAGRRRLSQMELPVVEAKIQAGSPDPEGLLANATAAFAMGGSFDTEVLPRYRLKMTAPTVATVFGEAASTSGGSSSSGNASDSSSSGSGGLSGGAIAGIVIGCLAGVAIVGALAFFIVKKNKNKNVQGLAQSQDNTSPAGSSASGKFSTGKDGATDDLA